MNRTRLLVLAAIVLGIVLGYTAATGQLSSTRGEKAPEKAAADELDRTVLPVPQPRRLRSTGYRPAAFGKWHLARMWEGRTSGPFARWPTGSGFGKFYGFYGGETNQSAPLIFAGLTKVEPPHDPRYHFSTDMTNQAIGW